MKIERFYDGLGFSKSHAMVYNKICVGTYKLWSMERSGINMNCKEAEKKIPYFLQNELDERELAEFVEHIESCPECKEELSIQFLVAEGMGQLEEGNTFNLQEALLIKMQNAWHRVKINRTLRYTLVCLEAAVLVAIIIALCIVFRIS